MYCNRCGTRLQQGTAVCPECGARQRRQTHMIRCAHCRGRAVIEMTVCPHCGRNLKPAGPLWSLWIPLGLLLAFGVYWGAGRVPVERVREEVGAAQQRLPNISDLVQLPQATTSTVTPTAAVIGLRTTSPIPSATRSPTVTPTRAPSATPSASPTTATQGEYTVQPGDSLAAIGEKLGIPWETIAAINKLTPYSMIQPGDKLRLPTATPAPTRATATATATAARATDIAVTATAARTATPVRPTETASPTLTPAAPSNPTTATPTATSRPLPTFTFTPTPTPMATPAPSLAAPILTNPSDQTSDPDESPQIVFLWESRDGLPRGAIFRLTITWIEKGAPVVWYWDTPTASLPVAGWLWGRADQPARQYTWSVQIVQLATDGKGGERVIPLSPPSERRTFYWY